MKTIFALLLILISVTVFSQVEGDPETILKDEVFSQWMNVESSIKVVHLDAGYYDLHATVQIYKQNDSVVGQAVVFDNVKDMLLLTAKGYRKVIFDTVTYNLAPVDILTKEQVDDMISEAISSITFSGGYTEDEIFIAYSAYCESVGVSRFDGSYRLVVFPVNFIEFLNDYYSK